MLVQRLLVALALVPAGMAVIAQGGVVYSAAIALILGLAAWEYGQLLRSGGSRPAVLLILGGVILIAADRHWNGFGGGAWILSLMVLASMTYHLMAFERGRNQAGTDFGATVAGILYIGWLGAYLISLRNLPEGKWWALLTLPTIWLTDSGAYFIGRRFGRRPFSPRLSPKKTWEGYLGGVLVGTLSAAGLAAVWRIGAGPDTLIHPARGALLGCVLGLLTPLGDLGESMFKRQVGVKDSGGLLPGHGGMLDRIDTWLWGAVIAHYLIIWFFMR